MLSRSWSVLVGPTVKGSRMKPFLKRFTLRTWLGVCGAGVEVEVEAGVEVATGAGGGWSGRGSARLVTLLLDGVVAVHLSRVGVGLGAGAGAGWGRGGKLGWV